MNYIPTLLYTIIYTILNETDDPPKLTLLKEGVSGGTLVPLRGRGFRGVGT
jgi:hypothetical protein